MIFIGSNNYALIIKLFVYGLHANTCPHKKFGTVLTFMNWLINLNLFRCLFHD